MTWVAPRTFVTDEFMTASMFNTNVRDNVGEAWREIELLTSSGNTGASNSQIYTTQAGVAIASFATRDYPGYPIEIRFECVSLRGAGGNWCVLGVTDGTPGNTALDPVMMQTTTEQSGLSLSTFTPTPGSHSYKVALWGGGGGIATVTGALHAWQARLMEKGLA